MAALGLGTLKRLVAVYALIEEQAAIDLQKSVSEVVQARNAVGRESNVLRSAVCDFEQARVRGDLLEATAATADHTLAERRHGICEKALLEREGRSADARKSHAAHRVKLEQMRRLLESANSQITVELEKKEQSRSDDRFLAMKRRKQPR